MAENTSIIIKGARVNNLKNIDVEIPRNKLVVITGLSGSGKSSLAFDTLYAEGQRRYVESLSSYARQFLGRMSKPECDFIKGIPPAIAIEQKVSSRNPRSTVGTSTEIYEYLRLLYARVGKTFSPVSGQEVKKHSAEDIVKCMLEYPEGTKYTVLAPILLREDRTLQQQLEIDMKQGFTRLEVNGEMMRIDEYKPKAGDTVFLLIDRMTASSEKDSVSRLTDSAETAMYEGDGACLLRFYQPDGSTCLYRFSTKFEADGITFEEPNDQMFSFNSPIGACPVCEGFGKVIGIDEHLVIPDRSLSVYDGAVVCWRGEKMGEWRDMVIHGAEKAGFPIFTPYYELTDEQRRMLWEGTPYFEGINAFFKMVQENQYKIQYRVMLARYRGKTLCPKCHGTRLKPEAGYVRVGGRSISELVDLPITELKTFFDNLKLDKHDTDVARRILIEINNRIRFLLDVGLGYLTLNRLSNSLSGGESQRIRLATQIGSKLVHVLYILDEPSIGLHQRDNERLIRSLKELRDAGNSVIVVEHDEDMMRAADYIVDVGPLAGRKGGRIVAAGSFDDILHANSITADYLTGRRRIEIPEKLRPGNGKSLIIRGARGNNLKNVDVEFPLGKLICVTGVSGSGKSTLVNETLRPILSKLLYRSYDQPLDYDSVEGTEHIDKLVVVDQAPIGRSPRSNPATYSNVFSDIRKLFESTPDAQIRGFKAGRFSFNVKGGRCEECRGAGVQTIEMNFLPDVYVTCKACGGHRYNRETLEVKYKGKNIDDVLNMTVNMAVEFFANIPSIHQKLKAIQDVGLGYLTLGQPCTTLSGGESQRIKLSSELSKRDTGRTLYILDEPTTGLHFEDIRQLLDVLAKLVDRGNTVIVIEHNLDVIKVADHLIDIGPEGGEEGGRIVATGTPAEVARCPESYTGRFLQKLGL